MITAEEREAVRSRIGERHELIEHFRRIAAAVDVVTHEHHAPRMLLEAAKHLVEAISVSVNIAYDGQRIHQIHQCAGAVAYRIGRSAVARRRAMLEGEGKHTVPWRTRVFPSYGGVTGTNARDWIVSDAGAASAVSAPRTKPPGGELGDATAESFPPRTMDASDRARRKGRERGQRRSYTQVRKGSGRPGRV